MNIMTMVKIANSKNMKLRAVPFKVTKGYPDAKFISSNVAVRRLLCQN